LRALALALALALRAAAAVAQAAPALEAGSEAALAEPGPVVQAIEIRSETPLGEEILEDLLPLLNVEVGQPLTDERVSRTLRNLQATGIASEIELYTRAERAADADGVDGEEGADGVDGADGEEGVVAVLVLHPAVRVEAVRVAGDLGGFREAELRRELPQGEAEPLSEDRILRGFLQLQEFYEERGHLAAAVRVDVDTDEATRRAVVTYEVQSGPRSQVAAVEFLGQTAPFTEQQLVERLEAGPGEPYVRRTVRDDAERLRSWLVGQGYGDANVGRPEVAVDPERPAVTLVYSVEVGPKVVVEVTGADLGKLRQERLLPFLGEQGYDETLVQQAEQLIERYYQQQGHYKVEVDIEEQRSDGVLQVEVTVRPGPLYKIAEIEFTGNESFREEELTDLMATSEPGWSSFFSFFGGGNGRLVQEELDADLENLRRFYQLQGFSQAEVGPARIEERGGELRIVIPIAEGPRQQVGELRFVGIEAFDPQGLDLPLAAGGPFHPARLNQALDTLRLEYFDRGYATAQVSAREAWDPEHLRVDVTIVDVTVEALEGPRMVLDRIIVRGNQRTDSGVIRRSLGVDTGDPISETRMLEIERELYRMGIFSSVDAELTWAGLETSTRDLVVRVREGRPRRVAYGLGIEYDSDESQWNPRGSVSFSHNNVAGRAFTFRTDLRLSLRENSFRLLFVQPYLGPYPVPVTYSLFYFDETRDHWDVTRQGVRVEAVRELGRRRIGLIYDYRLVEVELESGFPVFDVEREDRDLRVSSLIPSFFWDRRDDPVLATEGWSSLAQLQYAFPFAEAEGDFLKLFLQQTQLLNLSGGTPPARRQVVAASLRLGAIEPLADLDPAENPEVPSGLPSADVFIDERFFAGGPTTHRAYGRDDLGRCGETLVDCGDEPDEFRSVGGNGLLLFNLEYRFPLFGDIVGGTLFYDAGNVWADWRDIDFGQVRQGVGVGVRYNSPIGPLRLDIGWNLDREPHEESFAFHLNFGNPF
jgi:outer membrane protein assembly complex protein YaeT